MVIVKCNECGRHSRLDPKAGKAKCKCGAVLSIPDAGGAPAPAEGTPAPEAASTAPALATAAPAASKPETPSAPEKGAAPAPAAAAASAPATPAPAVAPAAPVAPSPVKTPAATPPPAASATPPVAARVPIPRSHTPVADAAMQAGDLEAVNQLRAAYEALREEVGQVIVGQDFVVEELLIAIFARGHCLLEGVPGLAKTLLVSTLARALDLSFKRIQFTPDLMPSDITGTEVIQDDKQTGERVFRFIKGPLFAHIVLADEINRTPPKTQAALLEAMQEKHITAAGTQYKLELPFFVLATQNPLEQEGTYPLPEAQLDRFLFKIFVDYPSDGEELEIMKRVTTPSHVNLKPVLNAAQIMKLQDIVLRVPVADHVYHYAKALVRCSRPNTPEALPFIKDWIRWGAGPRASLNLILAGKARAILNGQYHVACEDIAAVAPSVLRHRIACNFTAHAEGITTDKVVQRLIKEIPQTQKLAPEKAGK